MVNGSWPMAQGSGLIMAHGQGGPAWPGAWGRAGPGPGLVGAPLAMIPER